MSSKTITQNDKGTGGLIYDKSLTRSKPDLLITALEYSYFLDTIQPMCNLFSKLKYLTPSYKQGVTVKSNEQSKHI